MTIRIRKLTTFGATGRVTLGTPPAPSEPVDVGVYEANVYFDSGSLNNIVTNSANVYFDNGTFNNIVTNETNVYFEIPWGDVEVYEADVSAVVKPANVNTRTVYEADVSAVIKPTNVNTRLIYEADVSAVIRPIPPP